MTAPENKYAPSVWGVPQVKDLTVPSGQLCQVRLPGVQNLITAGVLDSADTLTSLVQTKHVERVKGKKLTKAQQMAADEAEGLAIMNDPTKATKLFSLVDKVVCYIVLQPAILPIPVPPEDHPHPEEASEAMRQPGKIYVDTVDLVDKMFLFQYAVGGDEAVERFRDGPIAALGGVATQ